MCVHLMTSFPSLNATVMGNSNFILNPDVKYLCYEWLRLIAELQAYISEKFQKVVNRFSFP